MKQIIKGFSLAIIFLVAIGFAVATTISNTQLNGFTSMIFSNGASIEENGAGLEINTTVNLTDDLAVTNELDIYKDGLLSIDVNPYDMSLRMNGENKNDSTKATALVLTNYGQLDDGFGAKGRTNIRLESDINGDGTIQGWERLLMLSCHGNLSQRAECTLYTSVNYNTSTGKLLDWGVASDYDQTLRVHDMQRIHHMRSDGYYNNETQTDYYYSFESPYFIINTSSDYYQDGNPSSDYGGFKVTKNQSYNYLSSTNEGFKANDFQIDYNMQETLNINSDNCILNYSIDTSQYFNNGFLVNGATCNNYLSFDSSNDNVLLKNSLYTNSKFSLVVNMNKTADSGSTYLLSKLGASVGVFQIYFNNDRLRVRVKQLDSSDSTWSSSYTVTTGEFVTYAITLESNDIKFYENGELKASGTISTELFDWDLTTTIGKNSDSLNAEIKWLMTFNQTLSEGQIQTLHQSYISSQNEVYVSATGGTLYGDYNFTSPNGQLWQCGPDNSGTWTCS